MKNVLSTEKVVFLLVFLVDTLQRIHHYQAFFKEKYTSMIFSIHLGETGRYIEATDAAACITTVQPASLQTVTQMQLAI